MSRPVKELKNFHKLMLKPGEEKVVQFSIDEDALEVLQRTVEIRSRTR